MTPPTHFLPSHRYMSRSMFDTGSAWWCSAQRIKIAMIAGGDHSAM